MHETPAPTARTNLLEVRKQLRRNPLISIRGGRQKTVGLAAASVVCALMVGCANTTTGKMVEPLEVMPTEVCIIQNPKVTIGEAIPSLQSAFQRRGIKTTVVRDVASCTSEYRLSYVMQRSWDATTYLGLAELTLYKNGAIVSTASTRPEA